MIDLLIGSLGEGQPDFKVIVSAPVSLAQAEDIVTLLRQAINEGRQQLGETEHCIVCGEEDHDSDSCPIHDA